MTEHDEEPIHGLPGVPPVMLLASPELRVAPVTVHEPLARAIARLMPEMIARTARAVAAALRREGWSVAAVWECQLRKPAALERRLARFLGG